MAITRFEILDGPSKFDLLMALFGEHPDGFKTYSFKARRMTQSNTLDIEPELRITNVGIRDFSDYELLLGQDPPRDIWNLWGEERQDSGRHIADDFVSKYQSRIRRGFLLFGHDEDLRIHESAVFSEDEYIGDVPDLLPFRGFLNF